MALTLWRHISGELWKLMLLATTVLVAVIAFAATVKPLADGKLTAVEAIRFMLLAVPPMLAYALPFAAGLAATLTYHRFAQDNELTAAHAGGMSHRGVLLPAVASGLLLAGGLGLLNDRIIPVFLKQMEQVITQDIAQLIVRTMEQGETARIDNVEIHADSVAEARPEGDTPYERQILLTGVAAVELDSDGAVSTEVIARQAWLLLMRAGVLSDEERGTLDDDELVAVIQFRDAVGTSRGRLINNDTLTTPPVALPSAFQDDPKFLTGTELRRLKGEPERMNWIDADRRRLARAMAAMETISGLKRRVADEEVALFQGADGRAVRVRTSRVQASSAGYWELRPLSPGEPLEVEINQPDGTLELMTAASARLELERVDAAGPLTRDEDTELSFRLELTDVTLGALSPNLPTGTGRAAMTVRSLRAPGDVFESLDALPSGELIDLAEVHAEPGTPTYSAAIATAADNLQRRIDKLRREVRSKQHERLAMSAACLVMIVLGAVMAVRLKQALPLIVYLWAFFPALGCVILISTGQKTIHDNGAAGIPVIWSGVVALASYAGVVYAQVRKH